MQRLERQENRLPKSNINQHSLLLAKDLYGSKVHTIIEGMDDIRDEVGLVLVIASHTKNARYIRPNPRYDRN